MANLINLNCLCSFVLLIQCYLFVWLHQNYHQYLCGRNADRMINDQTAAAKTFCSLQLLTRPFCLHTAEYVLVFYQLGRFKNKLFIAFLTQQGALEGT